MAQQSVGNFWCVFICERDCDRTRECVLGNSVGSASVRVDGWVSV